MALQAWKISVAFKEFQEQYFNISRKIVYSAFHRLLILDWINVS